MPSCVREAAAALILRGPAHSPSGCLNNAGVKNAILSTMCRMYFYVFPKKITIRVVFTKKFLRISVGTCANARLTPKLRSLKSAR